MEGNIVLPFEQTLARCRIALEKCCDLETFAAGDWAQSRLLGFNLWVASVGAFAQGKNAIRHRLQNSPDTIEILSVISQTLLLSVERCLEIGETPHIKQHGRHAAPKQKPLASLDIAGQSEGEIRLDVEASIRSLVDLGFLIRRAGLCSHLSKADSSYTSSTYIQLERQLEMILQRHLMIGRLSSTGGNNLSTEDMVKSVRQISLRMDQRRLIDTILRRRHRFIWARYRFNHAQEESQVEDKADVTMGAHRSVIQTMANPEPNLVRPSNSQPKSRPSPTRNPILPAGVTRLPGLPVQQSLTAGVTNSLQYAPSTRLTAVITGIDYPSPPAIIREVGVARFLCPCCRETCPAETGRLLRKWKVHVSHDLQPYACPHALCSAEEMFYTSKQSLIEHLQESHRKILYWQCVLCNETTYDDASGVERHIREEHSDDVMEANIVSMVGLSVVEGVDLPNVCPVCSCTRLDLECKQTEPRKHADHYRSAKAEDADQAQIEMSNIFEREVDGTLFNHICQHMHELSLYALPWNDRNRASYTSNELSLPAISIKSSDEKVSQVHEWLSQSLPESPHDLLPPGNLANFLNMGDREIPKPPDLTWSPTTAFGEIHSADESVGNDVLRDDEFFEDRDSVPDNFSDNATPLSFDDSLRLVMEMLTNIATKLSDTITIFGDLLSSLTTLQEKMAERSVWRSSEWQAIVRSLAVDDGPFETLQMSYVEGQESFHIFSMHCHRLNNLVGFVLGSEHETDYSKLRFAVSSYIHSRDLADSWTGIDTSEHETRTDPTSKTLDDLCDWLALSDWQSAHRKALSQRLLGSSNKWLLSSRTYADWKESQTVLWVTGPLGIGKTVLCSAVIEDHRHIPCGRLLYYYFSIADRGINGLLWFYRAMIAQLQPDENFVSSIGTTCVDINLGEELERALLIHLRSREKETVIVLDALDESPISGSGESMICAWLIRMIFSGCRLRVFATTRPSLDVIDVPNLRRVQMERQLVSVDIRDYVIEKLKDHPGLSEELDGDRLLRIQDSIVERANGSFLWASLLVTSLTRSKRLENLKDILDSVPSSLADIFEQKLRRVPPHDFAVVGEMLQLLAFQENPITLEGLAEACSIDYSDPAFRLKRNRSSIEEAIAGLGGLVTVQTAGRDFPNASLHGISPTDVMVQLAHTSVRTYLLSLSTHHHSPASKFALWEEQDRYRSAQTCLAYLIRYSLDPRKTSTEKDLKTFPFLDYAARSWMHQVAKAGSPELACYELDLLRSPAHTEAWLNVLSPEAPSPRSSSPWSLSPSARRMSTAPKKRGSGFFYACCIGLEHVVRTFLDEGADPEEEGEGGLRALVAASEQGHATIVRMLLDAGADVNAGGGPFGSAVQAASRRGHPEVVELLLGAGADVDAPASGRGNAPDTALAGEPQAIAQRLMDAGAKDSKKVHE